MAEYGLVIVDECHHLSAFSFEQVLRQMKAKFIVGLTATPARKDGYRPIIFMQCGPIRFSVSARDAVARSPFEHVVVPRPTEFRMPAESAQTGIQEIYRALSTDETRDQLIIDDVLAAVRDGHNPLVLSNRTDHLDRLAAGLAGLDHALILKGGMGKKQWKRSPNDSPPSPQGRHAFCWRPGVLSAKASTIRAWTLFS